jgi:hypothetical protein
VVVAGYDPGVVLGTSPSELEVDIPFVQYYLVCAFKKGWGEYGGKLNDLGVESR